MIIRRMFGFCAAHIVRNCSSIRCSRSLHGHNYKVEVFVRSDKLDNAGMILDFGIFKNQIADFIDGFDHAYHVWDREQNEIKDFAIKNSERYVILTHNPSAENYALLLLFFVDKFLQAMEFGNNEGSIVVESVRVHETDHGYAEAFSNDLKNLYFMQKVSLDSILFSEAIKQDWKDPFMLDKLKEFELDKTKKPFVFQTPLQQV